MNGQKVKLTDAVTFSLAIVDEVEPVKITAALIRQKTKPLTDLTITSIFDDRGYAEVKKAVTKTVKIRTGLEKLEKEKLGQYKSEYDAKKKEVTDYTAELYTACREAQTALEAKLTVIDTAKKEAADKLAADEKERTEGRDAKMYELGMTFNGQVFVGYGKVITKNSLYSLSAEAFTNLVGELEVLELEQGVTGGVKSFISGLNPDTNPAVMPNSEVRYAANVSTEVKYPTAIYDREVNGIRTVLTKGEISDIEPSAVIINDRVVNSAIYLQQIDYTR